MRVVPERVWYAVRLTVTVAPDQDARIGDGCGGTWQRRWGVRDNPMPIRTILSDGTN